MLFTFDSPKVVTKFVVLASTSEKDELIASIVLDVAKSGVTTTAELAPYSSPNLQMI